MGLIIKGPALPRGFPTIFPMIIIDFNLQPYLGGGFKDFLFSSQFGEMIQFD